MQGGPSGILDTMLMVKVFQALLILPISNEKDLNPAMAGYLQTAKHQPSLRCRPSTQHDGIAQLPIFALGLNL